MNLLATALLALATLGSSAAIAADCTDLAGQGTLCQDVSVDPASGVDADVVLTLAPSVPPLPPPPAAALAAPTCQDLAGQGFVCHDVSADPASGVNADVVVYVEPSVPPLPPPPAVALDPVA